MIIIIVRIIVIVAIIIIFNYAYLLGHLYGFIPKRTKVFLCLWIPTTLLDS